MQPSIYWNGYSETLEKLGAPRWLKMLSPQMRDAVSKVRMFESHRAPLMDVLRARKEFYWNFPHDTVRRATTVEHGLKDLTLIPSFRRPSQIRPDNQLKTTPELLERIRSSM